jgi:hypothetical protein
MFGGLKKTVMKKVIKSQLKNVPEEMQEKLMDLIEKNPELFQKLAMELQEMVKGGMDQQTAMLKLGTKYKDQLQGLM